MAWPPPPSPGSGSPAAAGRRVWHCVGTSRERSTARSLPTSPWLAYPRGSSPPQPPDPLPRLSSALLGRSVPQHGPGVLSCGGAQRAARPPGEPGTELSAPLPQLQASPQGRAEGESGKQEAELRCSSIPAVPPSATIIRKRPSVTLLGTMSPLPCLAPSSLGAPLRRWLSSPRSARKAFSTTADENGFAIQFYPSTTSVILMEPLWMGAGLSQRTAVAAS